MHLIFDKHLKHFTSRIFKVSLEEMDFIQAKSTAIHHSRELTSNPPLRTLYSNQISSKTSRHNIWGDVFTTLLVVGNARKEFYQLWALKEKIEIFKAVSLIDFCHFQDDNDGVLKMMDLQCSKILKLNHLLFSSALLFLYLLHLLVFSGIVYENLQSKYSSWLIVFSNCR